MCELYTMNSAHVVIRSGNIMEQKYCDHCYCIDDCVQTCLNIAQLIITGVTYHNCFDCVISENIMAVIAKISDKEMVK